MNLKTKIFTVLFCLLLNDLFSSDGDISEPETIIDLPDALIGKFMIFPLMRNITIHPNNLFFLSREQKNGEILYNDAVGQVIKEDDKYYLVTQGSVWYDIFMKTEIIMNDDGFIFYGPEPLSHDERIAIWRSRQPPPDRENNVLFNARRHRSLSVSEQAQRVNLRRMRSNSQYYIMQNGTQINILDNISFRLFIRNGIVTLYVIDPRRGMLYHLNWEGLLEIDTIHENNITGTVIAKNYNFAYANDGIASIDISKDRIQLTISCDEIGFNADIPEGTEISYPIIFIIEW
jgi:hypothetical protein